MVTILACENKKALKMFEEIPERIHQNDPYFVPPFPGSIVKIFGPKAPFKKHGDLYPFIALKDGKPVGRIAGIVNRSHNQYHNDKVGFFGFFDCIDDAEVSLQLFNTAKQELKMLGLDSIRGPYNPTSNDDFGLLIEGFESSPFVMMPYNPPYYLRLYEKLGLERARDFFAFYLPASVQAPARVEKIVERVKKSTGLTVRQIDMGRLKEELKIIHYLYNVTLDRNWGFTPVTYEDLEFAAEDLKAIADPRMVLIAEKNGQPAGYSLTLPNINELMWKTKNMGKLARVLKFIWLLKTSHPKEARLAALGIHPDFRNTGIAALFYYETLLRGKQKYTGGELSWVDENNAEIIKGIKVMGGEKYKSYRIFESPLAN